MPKHRPHEEGNTLLFVHDPVIFKVEQANVNRVSCPANVVTIRGQILMLVGNESLSRLGADSEARHEFLESTAGEILSTL